MFLASLLGVRQPFTYLLLTYYVYLACDMRSHTKNRLLRRGLYLYLYIRVWVLPWLCVYIHTPTTFPHYLHILCIYTSSHLISLIKKENVTYIEELKE